MSINIDISAKHHVVAANSHFYKTPTAERYIDRTLQYHDLIYLIDGRWAISENEQEFPLEKNDVLLLAAGRHHFTKMPCLPETRTFCIHITCEPGDNENYTKSISLPTHLHMRSTLKARKYFEDIVSTFWSENKYKQERMSALLDLLFLELLHEKEMQEKNNIDIATQAIDIITSTPHKRYQAQEVADMLYVSTKTLNNAMHKKVGMPFYSYQKNCKLEMVAQQLKMEPDVKLQEIALAFGFYDEFHMSKAFKQKYDISPQRYRKLNQQ